jgi:phosphatidate phosphatase APP1
MWANLLATYRRLESDEVAGARVEISLAGSVTETVTDHEGYYAAEIALSQVGPQPWITGSARLLYPATEPAVVAEVAAVVPRAADFAVVSDIDDTILVSDATHWLRAARRLFLQNARGRLTFPGVPEFYTALQAGAAPASFNPIFYVSSSPWNLYDLLTDFMAFQEIPPGPLFLRDYGLEQPPLEGYGTQGGHAGHKTLYIEQLLAAYPHLPFVLIGDSGQKDPEIYAAIAVRHPDRIRSIYIRDIAPALLEPRDAEVRSLARATSVHGVPMLLVADSAAAHAHAAQLGLVRG